MHDHIGPPLVGAAGTLALIPWLSTLDLVIRIIAGLASIAAAAYAIRHYRRLSRDGAPKS